MNKTIVIGVGGTGLEAIRALRKLIVENHKGLDVKEMRNLGFLYIDTDGTNVVISKDNKSKWEYLGQSIALNVNEYVIVSGPDVASIINDIDSYPHIKEWLPKEDLANINKTKEKVGASQVRPLGRFILTMSSEEVGAAFKQVFKRVPPPEQGGKTHVYVICSLSGGTGSGMFLDLAYKIRYWTDGGCKIFGFLVLPENPTSRGRRYLVNAYAALLELNYLSLASEQGKKKGTDSTKTIKFRLPGESKPVEGAPFDVCCIVGTKNDEGIELDINAIPAMIAHRIYLNFDSEFGAASARLLDNTETERGLMLDDAYTGNRHSRNFYTFGLSSIQYPIEQFLDVLSFRLSKALIDQWHREKDYPGDVNTRVLNNLSLLKLTDDYLLGDKDFFGSKHFEGFEVEVDTLVNSLKQTFPKHNIAPYLDTQLNQKISGFRGTGIADYYKNKRNTEDFNGALNEVRKLIRKQVSDDVINSDLGYEYCRKVLDELANILKEKQKLFVDKFNGLPAQEKNSRVSYNNFLNELTKIEGQTMPFGKDKKLRDCVNKIGEAMKSNLGAKIGLKAYELGIAFTKNVIDDIDVHKDNLKAWRDSVEKLKNDLASEVTKRITEVEKKIANVKEFNGSLLFSSSKIDDFYKALDLKSAVSYIEKEALASVGGGALDFRPTSNTIDSLYKIAVSWLQNISTYRISETNVADKLIEDYNDAYHRRALISSNFKKSCPFIQVSKAEISKGFKNDSYSLVEGTTNARIVGILNPEKVTSTDSLNTVIDDITDATGIRPPEWITDKHQILFLTEYSAFPLRIIREVASLREKYEDYFRQEEKPIPVHIAKSFDPPLMDLFLTTTKQMEETWRREENFILGRALNRLELSHNRRQGKDEIIFKYVDSGIPKTCTFGNSWEEAFANFMKDDSWITTARERLDKDLSMFLRDVDTKPKRDALWFMLDGTMKAVREGLEDKEKNPIYSKYTDIWLRIVKNNGLYDERNQPAERNRNLIDSPSQEDGTKREERERDRSGFDDPEKLSKLSEYVNAAFSKSKDGNLSRAYQDMLKRKQAECRISDEGLARLMDGARIKLVGGSKSELYRTVVADVLSKGVAGEEMEAILTEKRLDLGLSAEEAQSIEDEEKRSVYGALFERFSSGGTIADDEKALLTEKQIDLELSDDEVQSIEAEYSKRR